MSYAVVYDQWKLVTNQDASYHELYAIVADPYEKTDVKEEHADVARLLLRKLAQWQSTLPEGPDARCFSAERVKESTP